MKSYTDIKQSKKLAEILPLESADMCYSNDGTAIKIDANPYTVRYSMWKDCVVEIIPCWSLTALLSVLPIIENYYAEIRCINNRFCCCYSHKHGGDLYWYYAGNPVDACYEMILKLYELNLL